MEKNEELGLVKRVDEMGRVAVPIEIRKLLGIKEGGQVEFELTGNKLVISKYAPMNTLRDWGECIISSISSVVEYDIVLTDDEKVISASKKKYLKKMISNDVQEVLYKREIVIKKQQDDSIMLNIFVDFESVCGCQLIVPIVKDNDVLGSIIVLAGEEKCFDDDVIKVCKAFSTFLNCVIV